MRQSAGLLPAVMARVTPGSVVLCDMDGTLVDTDEANYLAYRDAVEIFSDGKLGLPPYEPDTRFTQEALRRHFPQLSESERNKIADLKLKCYKVYLPKTILNVTLAAIVSELRKTHVTVLITNCRRERAELVVGHHGLRGIFRHVIFASSAAGGSPTNKYRIALMQLGVRPESALVFEDGAADIADAVCAGILRERIFSLCDERGRCA